MKLSKITLGMIAVVAIGMFALPGSLSLGDNQHKFRQIDPNNVGDFCNRCHNQPGDSIQAQLNASNDSLYYSGPSTSGIIKIHSNVECYDCHQVVGGYGNATTLGYLDPTNKNSTKPEHAAVIPSCLDCHAGDDTNDVTLELTQTKEAHRTFWNDSASSNVPDAACVGCHTDVAKSGNPTYDYSLTSLNTTNHALDGITIGQ